MPVDDRLLLQSVGQIYAEPLTGIEYQPLLSRSIGQAHDGGGATADVDHPRRSGQGKRCGLRKSQARQGGGGSHGCGCGDKAATCQIMSHRKVIHHAPKLGVYRSGTAARVPLVNRSDGFGGPVCGLSSAPVQDQGHFGPMHNWTQGRGHPRRCRKPGCGNRPKAGDCAGAGCRMIRGAAMQGRAELPVVGGLRIVTRCRRAPGIPLPFPHAE